MKPAVAAAAAYELSVAYAEQGESDPAAFRRAARWARQSAAFLRAGEDEELRAKMLLESLRLDFYAAGSVSELRDTARKVEAFIHSCPFEHEQTRSCDDGLKLLGEVFRESASQGLNRPGFSGGSNS
jgi:hypothetical protein